MKKKDFTELKGKTVAELTKILAEKKMSFSKKRMEISAGKEKNTKSGKNLRQEIAKILSLISEKNILEKVEKKEDK